jgi:Acetyltransferase (GNAT) family
MGGAQATRRSTHVTLRPLQSQVVRKAAGWLKDRIVRESFVPAFPENESKLQEYFTQPTREYFSIDYNNEAVGIIGGENIDMTAGKLEMKKLVGESGLQGKGIGEVLVIDDHDYSQFQLHMRTVAT